MDEIRNDRALGDFFGPREDITLERRTTGQIAIAKDNARLFVGNVINQYSTTPNKGAFSIDASSISGSVTITPEILTLKVLRAVTKVTDRLRTSQRQAARVKIADLSIASLHTECSSIRLRLNQIKAHLDRDGQKPLEDRFEDYLLEEYEDVLQACCLPFSILNRHLENLGLGNLGPTDRNSLKSKLQELWAYERMEMICHNIRGLARAVDILCSAFQSDASTKVSHVMGKSARDVIANVTSDAISLHESFESATGVRERSIRDSIIGDEVFEFDNVLTSTTLYKKAYMRRVVLSQNLDQEGNGIKRLDSFSVPKAAQELIGDKNEGDQIDGEEAIALTNLSNMFKPPATMVTERQLPPESMASVALTRSNAQLRRQIPKVTTDSNGSDQQAASAYQNPKLNHHRIPTKQQQGIDVEGSVEDISQPNEDFTRFRSKPLAPGVEEGSKTEPTSDTAIDVANVSESVTTRLSLDSEVRSKNVIDIEPDRSKNLPTLADVLSRKTTKPYSLADFYFYMRDVQRAVDYLDFWLDVVQHGNLARHYYRNKAGLSSRKINDEIQLADLKANAEKILYTFLMPGAEREIVLPSPIIASIMTEIENQGNYATSMFDLAMDYVFEAMDRDAFPGFLKTGRPLFRAARKALGPFANLLIRT